MKHRTTVADNAPQVGIVRGLPGTYEADMFGYIVPSNPSAGWQRGAVIRGSSFTVRPPTYYPPFDPTAPQPAGWTRAQS
jgi:hypothetical protein